MELIVFDERVRALVDEGAELTLLDTGFTFTEGPVYKDGARYFTDFMVDRIYRFENGASALIDDASDFTIGMFYDKLRNRILCCTRNRHAITELGGGTVVDSWNGVRLNGTNDVIADSRGRLFFSDPLSRKIEGEQIGHSSVFMYEEAAGRMTLLDKTLTYPNGLALSVDEDALFIADTNACALYRLELAGGGLTEFVKLDEKMGGGKPDGLRLDKLGNIYTTGPGGVWLIAPDGAALGLIKTPEVAANLCFDDTGLFITASTSIYHVDTKIPPAV